MLYATLRFGIAIRLQLLSLEAPPSPFSSRNRGICGFSGPLVEMFFLISPRIVIPTEVLNGPAAHLRK
jgi:hypothetical protein